MNGNKERGRGKEKEKEKDLLPIREAYEWKHLEGQSLIACRRFNLLPIREASGWKNESYLAATTHIMKTSIESIKKNSQASLLLIREACEWKQCVGLIHELTLQFFYFQLVKPLNGNIPKQHPSATIFLG
jgi:hypothetical protein